MATVARTSMLGRLGDMTLPIGILAIMAMMVLPLPVVLLDTFFVSNIVLSLLVLMVALHSYRPLDFSSFPSILLIATVLRLALNVASTRIVLSEGHSGSAAAGKVIQAFGEFVIAGNFLVGLLVFAILVIINLVVITKGAGRVSEVSARFTLDAMPGKQMAIDADLNAGLLTPEDAKVRRADVAAEADFYGAMDGASKFVKGDAIAGILILVINVLGGILIGTIQHGLSAGDAAQTYILLSIGDGLVAQIPSLLLSIATAVIVTRVSSSHDMADLIGKQMSLRRAWVPVAGVMALLGMVPGMPNVLFLLAAAGAGAMAYFSREDGDEAVEGEVMPGAAPQAGGAAAAPAGGDESSEGIVPEDVTDNAPISLQIGYGLIQMAGGENGALVSRITGIRKDLSKAMGFVVPGVRIRDDLSLPPNSYRIRIGHRIVGEDQVYPDRKLALPGGASVRKLRGIEVRDPSFGMDAIWILPQQVTEAESDDYVVVEPESVIATHLSQVVTSNAADLIGPDDVQALLDNLSKVTPTLVTSVVPKLVPLHTLTAVLRHLLAGRIPISDLRRILEGLAELSGRNLPPIEMAEALRPSLTPLLLQQLGSITQPLPLITLDPELEQILIRARQAGDLDGGLVVDNGLASTVITSISEAADKAAGEGRTPVIVVASPLRRSFAAFLRPHMPDAIVIGINELPDTRRVEVVAVIGGQAGIPAPNGAR
ncbi:flagellar biosynthesis protein FlhA [Marivivens niveibacter]|uniref:Flagellar biosynthesis protein FlhA n=2 Tax=Marivivens niveibacter TaxID=1930667 RepID=A0A251X1E5_9RHOB|nr:flagellar biosynthesis protein FlhA [Marivivens niveibacter]OUD10208.1 flagellar biosynthesis protein FlhA [Marivivens niveibacter]